MIIPTILKETFTGDLRSYKWEILSNLVQNSPIFPRSILFSSMDIYWIIQEFLDGEEIYQMMRNKVSKQRLTELDRYGLLGLSAVDLKNPHCILTEGVSDFISVKLMNPDKNVLGLTSVKGSFKAKCIFINLFEHYTLVTDNDFNSERNTGMLQSSSLRKELLYHKKQVDVIMPESGFNDFTDNFIMDLKLECTS